MKVNQHSVILEGVGSLWSTRFQGKYDLLANFDWNTKKLTDAVLPTESSCPHCNHRTISVGQEMYHLVYAGNDKQWAISEHCHQEVGDVNTYSGWGVRCKCETPLLPKTENV